MYSYQGLEVLSRTLAVFAAPLVQQIQWDAMDAADIHDSNLTQASTETKNQGFK